MAFRLDPAAPAGTWGAAVSSILLIEERSGAHDVVRSALGLLGHDVVVAEPHQVRGRFPVAVATAAHVERARQAAKRVVLLDGGPRVVCDEVSRLLRS